MPGLHDDLPEDFLLPNHPRAAVSCDAAHAFSRWLAEKLLGQEVRLPTEAEREKAACGTASPPFCAETSWSGS